MSASYSGIDPQKSSGRAGTRPPPRTVPPRRRAALTPGGRVAANAGGSTASAGGVARKKGGQGGGGGEGGGGRGGGDSGAVEEGGGKGSRSTTEQKRGEVAGEGAETEGEEEKEGAPTRSMCLQGSKAGREERGTREESERGEEEGDKINLADGGEERPTDGRAAARTLGGGTSGANRACGRAKGSSAAVGRCLGRNRERTTTYGALGEGARMRTRGHGAGVAGGGHTVGKRRTGEEDTGSMHSHGSAREEEGRRGITACAGGGACRRRERPMKHALRCMRVCLPPRGLTCAVAAQKEEERERGPDKKERCGRT